MGPFILGVLLCVGDGLTSECLWVDHPSQSPHFETYEDCMWELELRNYAADELAQRSGIADVLPYQVVGRCGTPLGEPA